MTPERKIQIKRQLSARSGHSRSEIYRLCKSRCTRCQHGLAILLFMRIAECARLKLAAMLASEDWISSVNVQATLLICRNAILNKLESSTLMDLYATEHFCQRWINKASTYQEDELEDLFDKFFTLFVAYNRIYSVAAKILRSRMPPDRHGFRLIGDRNEATYVMAIFITQLRFSECVSQFPTVAGACHTISDLLQHRMFFLHSNRQTNEPDWSRDQILSEGLSKLRLKSILDCLYQIRCNIFHGEKEFADRQRQLLVPAITLLESVLTLGREALRASQETAL